MSESSRLPTTQRPHKNGAFDMDDGAFARALVVLAAIALLVAIYLFCKCRSSTPLVRRYGALPQEMRFSVSDDSEDDLLGDRAQLVPPSREPPPSK